jgi:hypothetical protein
VTGKGRKSWALGQRSQKIKRRAAVKFQASKDHWPGWHANGGFSTTMIASGSTLAGPDLPDGMAGR